MTTLECVLHEFRSRTERHDLTPLCSERYPDVPGAWCIPCLAAAIARSQPFALDTTTGRRQAWLREAIARRIEGREPKPFVAREPKAVVHATVHMEAFVREVDPGNFILMQGLMSIIRVSWSGVHDGQRVLVTPLDDVKGK